MRYLSISLSLLCFVSSFAVADSFPIRPVDPAAATTLARAIEGSAVVRALVRDIASTNVIVHIQFARDLPSGIAGTTKFVVCRGGYRYLRITISSALREHDRVPILGHELQHAAEIAMSGADHTGAIRTLLEADGYETRERFFETRAALRVERRVREEMRLEVEPVEGRAGRHAVSRQRVAAPPAPAAAPATTRARDR